MARRPETHVSPGAIVAILATVALVALIVVAGLVVLPTLVGVSHVSTRSEVPANVDGIKTAMLGYEAAFDELIPCNVAPRPVAALDEDRVPWTNPPDFDRLGWEPDGQVRGVYWVEVSPGGTSFEVYGMIDADGDGVPARYVATRDKNTVQLTPNHVH